MRVGQLPELVYRELTAVKEDLVIGMHLLTIVTLIALTYISVFIPEDGESGRNLAKVELQVPSVKKS